MPAWTKALSSVDSPANSAPPQLLVMAAGLVAAAACSAVLRLAN